MFEHTKEHGSPHPLDECHPKLGLYQSSLHAAVLYGNVKLVKTLLDACQRFRYGLFILFSSLLLLMSSTLRSSPLEFPQFWLQNPFNKCIQNSNFCLFVCIYSSLLSKEKRAALVRMRKEEGEQGHSTVKHNAVKKKSLVVDLTIHYGWLDSQGNNPFHLVLMREDARGNNLPTCMIENFRMRTFDLRSINRRKCEMCASQRNRTQKPTGCWHFGCLVPHDVQSRRGGECRCYDNEWRAALLSRCYEVVLTVHTSL